MTKDKLIKELESGLKNPNVPETFKDKIRVKLAALKAEEPKENKGKEKTTDVRSLIKYKNKFKVGDVVVLKGETTLEKEITSYKQNSKGEFVYKAKYVSKPEATGEWNEEELELILQATAKPKVGDIITFVESSNVDAPTLKGTVEKINQLGLVVFIDGKQYEVRKLIDIKIVGKDKKIKPIETPSKEDVLAVLYNADSKGWNTTKADSGGTIRSSDELTEKYANAVSKNLTGIEKGSLSEEIYDELVDGNNHLLNEFLAWNGYYNSETSKSLKKMYQGIWERGNRQAADPEAMLLEATYKPTKKKATSIKKAINRYVANREIKSVTILEDGKKLTYAGKDVLNGANFFKEGGVLTSKATYVPIRNIVEVTFEDGSKDKPRNGYHIRNGATPIMEHGGAVELPEGSLQHFENYYLEKGGKVGRLPKYVMDFQENDYKKMVQDYPDYPFYSVKNGTIQEIFSEKTEELVAKWNSKKKELTVYNPKYNSEVIVWLKENSFLTSDQVYEIDEMFEEEEYKLGGALLSAWKRERKYVNKSEDYEVRYAKGKNRKGYSKFAKGGPIPQKGDFAKVPVGYGMYHYGLIKGIIKDDPTYPQNGYEIVGIGDVLHPEQFKVVTESEFEKQKANGTDVKTNSFLVIEEKLEKGGVLKVGDEVVDFDTMKHLGKVVEVSEINLDEDDIIVETPEGKTIKLNSFNVLRKPNVKANLGASPEVKLSIEELKAKHSVSNYGKGGKTDKEDPRGANFRLAKEIRQPGERWQDAVSRATKMLK